MLKWQNSCFITATGSIPPSAYPELDIMRFAAMGFFLIAAFSVVFYTMKFSYNN